MKSKLGYLLYAIVFYLLMAYIPDEEFKINILSMTSSFYYVLIIYFFIRRRESKNVDIYRIINALIFAIFILIYKAFKEARTIMILFRGPLNILYTLLSLIIFSYTIYYLLGYIYDYLSKYRKAKRKNNNLINTVLYKHPFLFTFTLSLSSSLFYLLFFYPGTVAFDGSWQLNCFFRYWVFNNHHPAALTLLMGNLFTLGRNLINDNFGIFLFILIQIILNALTYGYVIKIMHKVEAPTYLRIFAFLFYTIFPLWVINSITFIKDTLYYLIFLFIFVYQFYHMEINKSFKWYNYLILGIMYILLYLGRNSGLYVGIISIGALLIYHTFKNKKLNIGFLAIIISLIITNSLYNNVFLPNMHIKPAFVREMMSIPLQQTARYIRDYGYDVNIKEYTYIQMLFKEDISRLGEYYDPFRSDGVKDKIQDYPKTETLNHYYEAWFSMFKRHPDVYIDATLENTYGYLFSDRLNFINEELGFYDISNSNPNLDIHFQESMLKYREMLKNFANWVSHLPLIGLLYACPIYVWLLFTMTIYLLKVKKYHLVLYFIPLYVTFLLCLVSPVNGHMRYLQPVALSMPIGIAFVLAKLDEYRK